MSKFYWNFLYPTGNRENAYRVYLQNKSHVNDITDCVNHNLESIKSTLQENNNLVAEKISNICCDLNSGFNLINNSLSQINSSIIDLTSEVSELSYLLDWNLSQIIEGQKITNYLLGNISNLLKIPDVQKERVYYIEEGLKFLRIGLDNQWDSEYFDDAYSSFKNALEREPKDFVSLSKIGFLHLFTKQYLDFSLAEEYYRKSMKYAYAEAFIGGTNFSNSMSLKNNKSSKSNKNIYLSSYLESVLYCARACALQNKFQEAIQLTTDAYKLSPNFSNAAIDAVKYLCVIDDSDKAIALLDEVISRNKFMTLRILKDLDIICNAKVSEYIDNISIESINNLDEKIKHCTRFNINDPLLISVIDQARSFSSKQSFLHSKLGLEILEEKRDWEITKLYIIDEKFNLKGEDRIKYIKQVINDNISMTNLPTLLRYLITKEIIELKSMNIYECLEKRDPIYKNNMLILDEIKDQLHYFMNASNIFGSFKYGKHQRNNAKLMIELLGDYKKTLLFL